MRIRKAFHRLIQKLSSPETNPFYYILLPFRVSSKKFQYLFNENFETIHIEKLSKFS